MTTLLSRGFRPFFLLATVGGVILLSAWLAAMGGWVPVNAAWHGHELVYGFMGAVIGGFLLTAVPKWTGYEPVTGLPLGLLAAAWMVGRAVLLGDLPVPVRLLEVVFPAGLTAITTAHVFGARSTRNLLFPVLLAAWTALDLAWHLGSPLPVLRGAVYALLGIVVIFAGRITPMFTRNALGLTLRPRGRIDDLAIGSVLLLLPAQLIGSPVLIAGLAFPAAALNLARMVGWQTRATLRRPLLLVLHLGYAGLVAGLALEGFAAIFPGQVSPTSSLHALTIGTLSVFAIGMMARVTRGHTGRPLRASKTLAIAFALLPVAAIIRSLGPSISPRWAVFSWHLSGGLWVVAFTLLAWSDTTSLLQPRVDRS